MRVLLSRDRSAVNKETLRPTSMDKEWAKYKRNTKTYVEGARKFVNTFQESAGNPDKIQCPCIRCINLKRHNFNEVYEHLIVYGMNPHYTTWIFHGEDPTSVPHENVEVPDIYRMYKDEFVDNDEEMAPQDNKREPDLGKLLEEAELPIYSGSSCTKMSAIVTMYKYKVRHSQTNVAFDEMVEMFRGFLPHDNDFPSSLYSAKKLLKAFDLGYEKIHACVRDCCLFRKELEHVDNCPKCGSSRWKVDKKTKKIRKGVPAKVLRYFPIIPRFRRMFKSTQQAEMLTWHHTNKSVDGMLRHPVDSFQWESVDNNWPSFAGVRGLGFGALPSKVDHQTHVGNKVALMENALASQREELEAQSHTLAAHSQEVNQLKDLIHGLMARLDKASLNNENTCAQESASEIRKKKHKAHSTIQSSGNVSNLRGDSQQIKHRVNEKNLHQIKDKPGKTTQILEGQKVNLLSWFADEELVCATAIIISKDHKKDVHHVPLGRDYWKVAVQDVFHDIPLIRPTPDFTKLEGARGSIIAWPIKYIKVIIN